MVGEIPLTWSKWLTLAEWWYNTSWYSSINTTAFETFYGYPPPFHIPYFPRESKEIIVNTLLCDREESIKLIKFHLTRVQNRMKQLTYKKRTEQNFEVGDWVYMKLKAYAQYSMRHKGVQKLQLKYFCMFKVLEKVGVVAYKLDLPKDALIHHTVHVSQLKLAYCLGNT